LDDFFFPDCTWYGLIEDEELQEIALLYTRLSTPAFLALGSPIRMPILLQEIINDLPKKFFCHYIKELEEQFLSDYKMTYLGTHLKMRFEGFPNDLKTKDISSCINLTEENEAQVVSFYQMAFPETYFEPYMLATGKYFGYMHDNELKSIAGVHVYSKKYNIATVGNITTHPNMRRRGFAKKCIITLLKSLMVEVEYIGLNVKADNSPAISLYKQLGFVEHAEYEEALFEKI
ncbi:MAG: GNAT family N-acetyltransferase, partial [Candidatus Hodarchaeota archaeon]